MDFHDLNYAQKQKHAYIDFKLFFVGDLTRFEVVNYLCHSLLISVTRFNRV